MQLKIRGCHFTFKVANKIPNVRLRAEVIERNKDGPFPSLLSCESVKDSPDRKKVVLRL